jgi:tetratricopeptide (TPR) repeat protein
MSRVRTAGLALSALLGAWLSASAVPLSETARLAPIYDLILDARFDDAAAEIARACPPAPPVTCQLLDVTSLWWRIQLDPDSTALDPTFATRVDAAIAAAEAWTTREPSRAEAWFYLGAAYGARVQWRVLRTERLAAARDGKRIKESLDRALTLDPDMADARFGLGLYKYYADIAPAIAKFLRFLLFLPGGDREEGLRDMLEAHERGALVRGEAEYQLHWIYFWYEQRPQQGLALLQHLQASYPHNPLFPQRIAEVQVEYFHDPSASLTTWMALADAAQAGRVGDAPRALVRARLGAAEQLDALYETDRALSLATAVVASNPTAPFGAAARAHLLVGTFEDRLGRHDRAVTAYSAALAVMPPEAADLAARARAGLRSTPDPRSAEAYRQSLEGWRALEQKDVTSAARLLDRARALAPDDPVIEYRRGRVYLAEQRPDEALAAFAHVIARRAAAPPVFLARAYLDQGFVLEARHDELGAIEAWRSATHVFGADSATRTSAHAAITRATTRGRSTVPPR